MAETEASSSKRKRWFFLVILFSLALTLLFTIGDKNSVSVTSLTGYLATVGGGYNVSDTGPTYARPDTGEAGAPSHTGIQGKNGTFAKSDTNGIVDFSTFYGSKAYNFNVLTPTKDMLVDVTNTSSIDYGIHYLETSKLGALPSLPNYRSPCWFEPLGLRDPYPVSDQGHIYLKYFKGENPIFNKYISIFRSNIATFQKRVGSGYGWRLRCLPYFYVIGINRGGSTGLWAALVQHPDITGGTRKELHYWNEIRLGGGLDRMGWTRFLSKVKDIPVPRPLRVYADLFDMSAEVARNKYKLINGTQYHPTAIAEASPTYLTDYDNWEIVPGNEGLEEPKYILPHILRVITPQVKTVAILRNPIDRLFSEYVMYMGGGKSAEKFDRLVRQAIDLMTECLSTRSLRSCVYDLDISAKTQPAILKHSMYFPFIKDWVDVLGREKLLVVRSEDFYSDTNATCGKIFRYLGLADKRVSSGKGRNGTPGGRKLVMWNSARTLLDDFFRPYNQKLADLMGDKSFLWS